MNDFALWCIDGCLIILFVFIAYQDFKDRAVYWWLYALVFVAFTISKIYTGQYNYEFALINGLFLILQYLLVIIYFSLKNRKMTWLLTDQFGLGDALLIFVLACFMNTSDFLFIYLVSLIASVIWVGYKYLKEKQTPSVPLAGVMAIASLMIIVSNYTDFVKLY